MLATHTGDYLDAKATNKPVEFNGLDFWKLENDRYIENWVFVDMVHLFRQFGIDLFERMRTSLIELFHDSARPSSGYCLPSR